MIQTLFIIFIIIVLFYFFAKKSSSMPNTLDLSALPIKSTSFPFDVHVITIPRLKSRQESIAKHLTEKQIPFTFHFGVDGNELTKEMINKYSSGDKISNGQVGCFLSHYTLWQKLKNNMGPTLILEDDSEIIGDPTSIDLPDNFDIIYFGHYYERKSDKKISNNLFESVFPIGAHAMLISKSGIDKLLAFFDGRKIHIDFDVIYSYHLINNKRILNAYSAFPILISQNVTKHGSEIGRKIPSHDYYDIKN